MNLHLLAQLAGVSLIAGIWQGFLLAAFVWLCLRLVPKTTATQRFTLWSAVFLLIALLPWLERPQPASAMQPHHISNSLLHLDPRWSLALAAVWLAFTLFRAGDLALNALRLRALGHRSVPVAPSPECAALLQDGSRPVQLCTSIEVDRPSVIGFLAPRILIPEWLLRQLTASELEQVVLHEMEHLRRGDDWLNLLQKFSLVLFPLNPILLWIERRLCFERELACDDGVLRRTQAPRAYATCLTTLAERGLDHRALSLALGALARQSELAQRVHRILRREAALSPLGVRAVTGALTLGLLGGAAGLAHCPQLVSFTAPASTTRAALSAGDLSPARIPAAMATSSTWVDTLDAAALQPQTARARNVSLDVSRGSSRPHMALLQASMPIRPAKDQPRHMKPARRAAAAKPHRLPAPSYTTQRVSENDAPERTTSRTASQGWVLLTSWTIADRLIADRPVADRITAGRTTASRTSADPVSAAPTSGDQLSGERTSVDPSPADATETGQLQKSGPASVAQPILLPYAAVRVDGGWLILQL